MQFHVSFIYGDAHKVRVMWQWVLSLLCLPHGEHIPLRYVISALALIVASYPGLPRTHKKIHYFFLCMRGRPGYEATLIAQS